VQHAVVLAAAVSLLLVAGCGGYRGQKETSAAAAVVGEPVQVEGVLSMRGSTPHTTLVLEIGKDEVVMIHSKTIQAELNSLSGMRVAIEGESLPSIDGETPLINALRYRLLRLPSGELPVVGVVSVVGERCLLEATDGRRYWIRGDFTGLISDFDGAKIWVIGALGDPAVPDKPKGTVPYWVTGYGVLATP
jgi:hypothetical protein